MRIEPNSALFEVLLESSAIRSVYFQGERHFSLIDITQYVTGISSHRQAQNYWHVFRIQLTRRKPDLATKINKLKMRAADNKFRYTDAAPKSICRVIADEISIASRYTFNRIQKREDEVRNFHPLVAQYLTESGYCVERGVSLKSGKIIDLIAQKSNEILLVECKNKLLAGHFYTALGQVLSYSAEYGNCVPILACPVGKINQYGRDTCAILGIRVLEI